MRPRFFFFFFFKYLLLLFSPSKGTMKSHPETRVDSGQGKLICQVRCAESNDTCVKGIHRLPGPRNGAVEMSESVKQL
ncbi:hypothetical protein BGX38DRAFT_781351 [Terfezia claveryi]|nr:hypothetical protein BGX38DRAFT_781351 [Terfezia claveryi]